MITALFSHESDPSPAVLPACSLLLSGLALCLPVGPQAASPATGGVPGRAASPAICREHRTAWFVTALLLDAFC